MISVHMDADRDAILAKLEAKGAEPLCPVCRVDAAFDLSVPDGAKAFLTIFVPDSDDGGGSARSLHVVPLICRNCGYVRLHSPVHLLKDEPAVWREPANE